MADNVTLPGATEVIAADEVGGAKYQRVKVSVGADGTAGDWPVGAGTASGVPRTTLASDDPAVAVLGATNGAAVITDADGTIHRYLRGLVKLAITAGGFMINIAQVAGQAAITGGVNGSMAVGGNVAHGTANSGNPHYAGAEAIAHGTNPTQVAAGSRTKLYANRHGIPFGIGGHPNVVSYGMSITTAVSNTVVGPTVGSGAIFICTSIAFLLDNGSTVFPSVVIGFGAASTPAFATTPGTAKILAGHPACPAGGGMSKGDGSGIIGIGGDGEEVRITTVGNAGGNGLYVLLTGYTVET